MRRILFDEDVPRPLRNDLPGFEIHTVVEEDGRRREVIL